MIILGISDSVESHACLIKDGVLIAAHAEERFSRIKSDAGYPCLSIKKILEYTGISPNQIDFVALAGYYNGLFQALTKPAALFSISDWIEQNEVYWKPKLIDKKPLNELDDFLHWENRIPGVKTDPYYPFVEEAKKSSPECYLDIFNKYRKRTIANQLDIDEKRIVTFRHEQCHQYYGYYSQQQKKQNTLILTLEGGGDDSSATISQSINGLISEKYKTNQAMLGRIYRYITLLLGMKPGQHEYKVMGLAPYGQECYGEKSLNHFNKYNKLNGTKINKTDIFKDVYFSSREELHGERFDGIAWGLQKFTEEFIGEWVKNNIKEFKLSNIIFSGGVAQNIKALKCLVDLPEVSSVWSGPASGDGSLAIGAAWIATSKFDKNNEIKGLDNIYLGTEIKNNELRKELSGNCKEFKIVGNVSNDTVAEWLTKGLVIARCKGRMEFGQRALGNRSILADPRNYLSAERINRKIKYRDFWMPFTPSISFDGCKKILKNKKNIYSPFMTMAFDLNDGYAKALPAVIHPADKTTRPQMLKRDNNSDYYDLIERFEEKTGFPVILNTSFNLHSDAIVENANQAIETFKKSDLDILLINNVAIIRRETGNEK